MQDFLIAAIVLRYGASLAHRDGDYEHLAHATSLKAIDLRQDCDR